MPAARKPNLRTSQKFAAEPIAWRRKYLQPGSALRHAASPGNGANGGADPARVLRFRQRRRPVFAAAIGYRGAATAAGPDAFSNPDHLKFAVRGAAATMLAYVVYQAIDWTGLSTAVPTCIITALSTIGSSRQKQFLRLGGAIIGGFVFGTGAQVFVLPYLDSITGFTVLFAVVTAISAWIAVATPRLSYLGVQLALAFYLINLQEFAIQSSLAIARDRIVGVLLGLLCMWLVFDRCGFETLCRRWRRVCAEPAIVGRSHRAGARAGSQGSRPTGGPVT